MARPKSPVRLDWVDPAVCSLDYRLRLIGRLPFFKQLPAAAISTINALFHDFDVPADGRIYFEGDAASRLYIVALGKVKLVRHTAVGRAVLLDILRGGEYFGALTPLAGETHTETAIAQTDCCILQISSADFEQVLAGYPGVAHKVLEAVSRRLAESHEVVKQLSAFTVEQRIAATLLRLAGKLGETAGQDLLIQLPFSRQDLAEMTGSTPETVSRVISRFASEGLLKTGRQWITLTDPQRLADLLKMDALN